MTKLNLSSVFMYFFYVLFSLSFFHTDSQDLQILLISGGIALLSLLVVGFNFFYHKEKKQFNIIIVLISLWLASVILPIVLNVVQPTAQYGLFQCGVWISAFFLIISTNNLERHWHQLKKLIYLLGFICSVWAIIQHYSYHYMATGPFANRNSNGAFLMLSALILCSELLSVNLNEYKTALISKLKSRSIGYSILFLIINLGLLLSFSRAVYLIYCFSLLFLFWCNATSATAKKIIFLSALIALVLSVFVFSAWEAIQHRLDILAHEKSRMIIWRGAWHLWQNSPWYGIGIDNFKYFYPPFSLPGDGSTLENAHNDYLQLLIETGIPGATILFALILSIFIYGIQYLKKSCMTSSSHLAITTQMAGLGALAMYSFVDFGFYILSLNLMLGVLLGFLYKNLAKQGCFGPHTPTIKSGYKKILSIPLAVVFLFLTNVFLNLVHYVYYTEQANDSVNQGRLAAATASYNQAQRYLASPDVFNSLASLYLERAKKTNNSNKRIELLASSEELIEKTIRMYPYIAEPYFQRGILYALYYEDNVKAQASFETFMRLKPQANFERLTFCYFLLEQDQLFHAQDVLEKGLLYPIDDYYAPKYLELLANLRLKNGDNIGAQQIADAINHIETYRLDFSPLANPTV